MNKKIALFLFLCVCGWQYVYSQTHGDFPPFTFEVRDSSNTESLVGVTCRVYSSSGKFYSYGISDKSGTIKLNLRQSDWIEFSLLGYKKLKYKVNAFGMYKRNTIYMVPNAVALREVQIKAAPISARNDTLIYRVGAFAKMGDRHLEDVLKRLPGVKVSDNGTVSVQGKAINKFYVEGMDLMGGSYNQITKNMPIDAVTTVEVLENHQPVKLLQGKQLSDKAAINIRIDKSHKARPFGEVEVGLGLYPSRWDNRAFVTKIANKSQLLVSGKINNTGNDLSEETTEHIDITDLDAYEPISSPLLITDMMQEFLPQNRYISNKSYAGGFNFLRKLTASSTLRFNTQLYEDHSSRSSNIESSYGGSSPLVLKENTSMKKKDFTIVPVLRYELNSARSFVSDELKVSVSKKSALTAIFSNASSLQEAIKVRPLYIQNYFSSSFPVGNVIVQAKSLMRYFDRSESLDDISDSTGVYNYSNRYTLKSFLSKNVLSSKILLFQNYLDLGAKVYYQDNHYDYNGKNRSTNIKAIFTPGYYIKYGKRSGISIALPIGWLYARVHPMVTSDKSQGFFSLSPELSIKHAFSELLTMDLSASASSSNDNPSIISPFPLRTGYRTVFVADNNLYRNADYLLSLRLKYRDLASMFFSNISVSYLNGNREHYLHYDYTDSLNIIRQVQGDNHHTTLILNGMADKSFIDAGITLKTELTYNKDSYLLSQSSEVIKNNSHVLSAVISAAFQKLKWLRLVLDAAGTLFWEKNSYHNSETLSTLRTNASLYLFPFKGFEIRMKCQSSINEIAESQYKNLTLLDASVHYKINKTWELSVTGTNLLNTKLYSVTQNSGLNSYSTYLPLRNREVLARLLLRF